MSKTISKPNRHKLYNNKVLLIGIAITINASQLLSESAKDCWEITPETQPLVNCACRGIFQCTPKGNSVLRYDVCNNNFGTRSGRKSKDPLAVTVAGTEWDCVATPNIKALWCIAPCAAASACLLVPTPFNIPCLKGAFAGCTSVLAACGFTDIACSVTDCQPTNIKPVVLPTCKLLGPMCGVGQ
jgi:hypothetical protein